MHEDLGWLPPTCESGHELGPGRVSLSWVSCICQPGSIGHHVGYCRRDGCKSPPARPPGCPGPKSQR
jgi:hypothetical protein